jgi:hypothetical protein
MTSRGYSNAANDDAATQATISDATLLGDASLGDGTAGSDESSRQLITAVGAAVDSPRTLLRSRKSKYDRELICKPRILLHKPRPDVDNIPTRHQGLTLSLQCPPPDEIRTLIHVHGIDFQWIPDSFLAYNKLFGCVYYAGFRFKNYNLNIRTPEPPEEFLMGDFVTIETENKRVDAQIVACYQATNPKIYWQDNDDENSRVNVQEKGE